MPEVVMASPTDTHQASRVDIVEEARSNDAFRREVLTGNTSRSS
jgi:hypothetical protein